jgi:endonuclease/exonuclease/phosphatase family metal-dependent hydrolase
MLAAGRHNLRLIELNHMVAPGFMKENSMPRYAPIRFWRDDVAKRRTLDRLLALRRQLAAEIGPHRGDASLLLATWNIRDFDSNKFRHGPRLPESFHYIAEIVSWFDLVAVQEVNRDLAALRKLMSLLGPDWDYLVTDTTEGSGGNEERIAFVFDRRRVRFRNVAGEVVLPKSGIGIGHAEGNGLQFARSPFVVAFQAGWFKFNLCAVHIFFGADSGARLQRRIDEIRELAAFFSERQDRELEDTILLGDFNIVSPEHRTMEALEGEGFAIPENLKRERTNLRGDKHYDQIALKVQEKRLEIGASGVLAFAASVFRDDDEDFLAYRDHMPADRRGLDEAAQRAYYAEMWRTWQMSDHLPMWVQLKVDFTEAYLESLKPGHEPLADLSRAPDA